MGLSEWNEAVRVCTSRKKYKGSRKRGTKFHNDVSHEYALKMRDQVAGMKRARSREPPRRREERMRGFNSTATADASARTFRRTGQFPVATEAYDESLFLNTTLAAGDHAQEIRGHDEGATKEVSFDSDDDDYDDPSAAAAATTTRARNATNTVGRLATTATMPVVRSLGRLAFNNISDAVKNDIIRDHNDGTNKYPFYYYDLISKAKQQRLPLGRASNSKTLQYYKERSGLGRRKIQLKDSVKISKAYLQRICRNMSTHIKRSHIPVGATSMDDSNAWEDFRRNNFGDESESTKFMHLLYYTYNQAFISYYEMEEQYAPLYHDFIIGFDKSTDSLEQFIYDQFLYFDENITLEMFQNPFEDYDVDLDDDDDDDDE